MSTRREFLTVTTTLLAVRGAPRLQYVTSASAPKAIGPYSQAVRTGNMLYASGQIALDPATGNLIQGDFAAQARRVLDNLKAVLHEAGADFSPSSPSFFCSPRSRMVRLSSRSTTTSVSGLEPSFRRGRMRRRIRPRKAMPRIYFFGGCAS